MKYDNNLTDNTFPVCFNISNMVAVRDAITLAIAHRFKADLDPSRRFLPAAPPHRDEYDEMVSYAIRNACGYVGQLSVQPELKQFDDIKKYLKPDTPENVKRVLADPRLWKVINSIPVKQEPVNPADIQGCFLVETPERLKELFSNPLVAEVLAAINADPTSFNGGNV